MRACAYAFLRCRVARQGHEAPRSLTPMNMDIAFSPCAANLSSSTTSGSRGLPTAPATKCFLRRWPRPEPETDGALGSRDRPLLGCDVEATALLAAVPSLTLLADTSSELAAPDAGAGAPDRDVTMSCRQACRGKPADGVAPRLCAWAVSRHGLARDGMRVHVCQRTCSMSFRR